MRRHGGGARRGDRARAEARRGAVGGRVGEGELRDGAGSGGERLRVDGGVGERRRVGEDEHGVGDEYGREEADERDGTARKNQHGHADEQRQEGGQADGAEERGQGVGERGAHHLAGRRRGLG